MAGFEIENETHEITLFVNLADDSPVIEDTRGLRFKPLKLSVLWMKENAGEWEVVRTEIVGKRTKTDAENSDVLTNRSATRSWWCALKYYPGWLREIVEESKPVEVTRASTL